MLKMRAAVLGLCLAMAFSFTAASCEGNVFTYCPLFTAAENVTINATRVVDGAYSCEPLSVNVSMPNGTVLQQTANCANGLQNTTFPTTAQGNYLVTFYTCGGNQSSCTISALKWAPPQRVPETSPLAGAAAALLAAFIYSRRAGKARGSPAAPG